MIIIAAKERVVFEDKLVTVFAFRDIGMDKTGQQHNLNRYTGVVKIFFGANSIFLAANLSLTKLKNQ